MLKEYRNKGSGMTLSEIVRKKNKGDKVLKNAVDHVNYMAKAGFTDEDLLPINITKD
jgi:hypothetical protein